MKYSRFCKCVAIFNAYMNVTHFNGKADSVTDLDVQ